MAYWYFNFKSRDGYNYQVQISGKSGNTNVELVPAEVPFVTQEEGNEDLFVPIKTQTGSINIVTNDIILVRDIIPTKGGTRAVQLLQLLGGSMLPVWKGFVQPQMFEMKMFDGWKEVSIPIECQLSAYKYKPFNYNGNNISVLDVLKMFCGDFASFVFQGGAVSSTNLYDYNKIWLRKKVNSMLFSEDESSWYDVLAAICTFFNWCARTYTDRLYLLKFRNVDADNINLISIDSNDINNGYINRIVTERWIDQHLSMEDVSDNNVVMKIVNGVKYMSVRLQLESFDFGFNAPMTDIAMAIDSGTLSSQLSETRVHNIREINGVDYEGQDYYYYYTAQAEVTVNGWKISSYNVDYTVDKKSSGDVQDWEPHLSINCTPWRFLYEAADPDDPTDIGTYSIYLGKYDGWLQMVTTESYTFVKGKLTVKFNTSVNGSIEIKIGATTYTTYRDGEGNVYVQIPDGGAMGVVTIKITNTQPSTYQTIDITSVSFTFEQAEELQYNSGISDITYKSNINQGFSEEKSVDSKLGVKEQHMRNSKTFVINNDGTPCTELYVNLYGNTTYNPLQQLANDGGEEMRETGELLKANFIAEAAGNISPLHRIYIEELDATYYPVSISKNWIEDVFKLKLLKRRFS